MLRPPEACERLPRQHPRGQESDLVHFDIPSIHIELGSTLRLSPLEHMRRHSVTDKRDSEEESESTAL
ncbi:Rho GTPase-activating protein 44 [Tupaia chinensis]|uniref:Rho GTPase-activating protein 44 n=1 Tax=Tupaia chinensis TaxID=246437 RepID=L9JPY0_TUPCH|nr:Rho GTPase-activating protein 44 [Tupaia chinensis]